ncbi:MAG: 23S rRNA (adenine(2503)-C(2))-methyltransferase RlmN [Phycisphaerales bacterium]
MTPAPPIKNHFFDFAPETLRAWCEAPPRRWPGFKADQILEWVYKKRVIDPMAMTTLSKLERETLAREVVFLSGRVVREQAASDGTRKLLVEWDGGTKGRRDEGGGATQRRSDGENSNGTEQRSDEGANGLSLTVLLPTAGTNGESPVDRDRRPTQSIDPRIDRDGRSTQSLNQTTAGPQTECVMIPSLDPSGPRRTACISSQVGCPVGCKFCASGLGGFEANLSAGRIVEQVWLLGTPTLRGGAGPNHPGSSESQSNGALEEPPRRGGVPTAGRITNVVFMGMGEPLANLPNVVRAVRTIAALWGLGISARKITISTVGLPKAIEKLAQQLELPVTLALSLHAPNDDLRRTLIPWAEYTTIADLLAACRKWFEKTGREITLEYTLLRGINDKPEHAVELAQVAKSLRANVNLIRYNEVAGLDFKRPRDEDVREFQRLLVTRNVNTHIRRSRGRDIAAACGQLRHETAKA